MVRKWLKYIKGKYGILNVYLMGENVIEFFNNKKSRIWNLPSFQYKKYPAPV